jgi:dTMP kinase
VSARFVVLEGGDGSGKSTQAARLAAALRARGLSVTETREPGGTELGKAIRALVLDGGDVDPLAETLLMAADRAQHVAEVIEPALAAGSWVVSDRFVPSSLVYQGIARGVGVDRVDAVNQAVLERTAPDLVIVLDVSDETAAQRRSPDGDRIERAGTSFHAEVRAAYRALAGPRAWVVVDANGEADAVAKLVLAVVDENLAS